MTLREILTPINALLTKHGIRYAVIGGYAVAAWGKIRATRDIDLMLNAGDLEKLKSALADAEFQFEHRRGDADDPIADVICLRTGTPETPYEVDFLAGIRGTPAGIFDRARDVSLDDLVVPVASPEDMIVLKMLGGAARDFEDARGIIRAQKGKLDLRLLRQLCPEHLGSTCESLLLSP